MPNQPVRASAIALPGSDEPAFVLTDAGRAYLLLEDIAEAEIVLPSEIAAELAALTSREQADV
jgi:hypothetical protein